MKFNWTSSNIIIVASILLTLFSVSIIYGIITHEASEKEWDVKDIYYKRYENIKLNGKIVKKESIDNDRYSIYTILINTTSVKQHDLRDSLSDYFLFIKGDTAKMVFGLSTSIFVEDSIEINYKGKIVNVYRNNKLTGQYSAPSFSEIYLSKQKQVW